MTNRETLFRRVYASLLEGRRQQAQRVIAEYVRTHRPDPNRRI